MAITVKADNAEIIEQRVSTITTETLIQEAVSLGTIRDFSSQVGPGMDRLDIPLFNELAIQDVLEAGEVTPQTIDPTAAQLPLNRHKSIPFAIGDLVSMQAKANLVAEAVRNGARSLAAEIDDYVFGLIDANASTAGPDHRLALTADPLADLAKAKQLLDEANVPRSERYVAASPGFINLLLSNSNVINADKYGAQAPIQAGFVSRVYGFTIVETSSSSILDGGFQAYHRNAVAFARQMAVKFESERNVLGHRFEYSMSHLYGGIATDASGVRTVVFDTDGV